MGRILPHPQGSGEGGTVHIWWMQQFFDIFGKKGDTWHMILEYNPAGHCFLLRDLVLIELIQVSHNCVTEWMLQGKFLLKLVYKLLEISFFPSCGIFQYVIFLSNRRGTFKILGLQGDPPPQFPGLVGHPDLFMRKTLRVFGLLTVMIFFQSKNFTTCKVKDEKEETILYFLWWCSTYWRLSIHLKVRNI